MTLSEFALVLGVDPKWVQNAAATISGRLSYSPATARRLAIARALTDAAGMPLPRAYRVVADVLAGYGRSRKSVALTGEAADVTVAVDVYRILSAVSVGLSRLHASYQPRRRGRPASSRDPLRFAERYGLDLTLLAANLRRTPAERLRQLDAMTAFRRRVRRRRRS